MEIDQNEQELTENSGDFENNEKVLEELPTTKKIDDQTVIETTQTSEETNSNEGNDDDKKEEKIVFNISNTAEDTFKKPVLIIGPRRGHPTKVRTLPQSTVAKACVDSEQQTNDNAQLELLKLKQKEKFKLAAQVKGLKEKQKLLDYAEPAWSNIPEGIYKLEILKSGVILDTVDLSKKSYYVVGRSPNCDISMAHPTISRVHAVFQYRAVADEKNEKGMYIYDLGSTHGTFWNGNRIKPKIYVRLQGGHMIRFGCSQRKFILQAPITDQEPESEFTITELKEMRRLELEEREKLEKQRLLEEEEAERLRKEKEESEGIDWGMGEDADEETDLTENPYAQTNNEELFLDDPKKTLRGWFEREGYDLQYQTEDKGIGRFLCWVELPLDNSIGRTIRAEALVTGKKKEAVVQCALEACRILDRYGLLRQANHEARKRKARNWEEEDYYDSDEDNFLDRTGTIEKKREQRMRIAGKLDTKAETYDSLLEKHSKVTEKIQEIENILTLQKLKRDEAESANEDALDAFMSSLDSSTLDKTEIRKMKIDLIQLRKEELHLLKLINIAKPANLPLLKPHVPVITKKSLDDFKNSKVIIGHKKKIKSLTQKCETVSKSKEDYDENKNSNDAAKDKLQNTEEDKNTCKEKESVKSFNSENEDLGYENVSEKKTKIDFQNEEELEQINVKKKKKNMKRNQQRAEKAAKEIQKGYDEDAHREDYDMWIPPENQSGDGKTCLNDKFGY